MRKYCKRKSHTIRKLHMIYISSNKVRHPVTKTFTTLHYTSPKNLHYISLHFTQKTFTTFHYTSPKRPSLHFTTLHPKDLHYTSIHFTQKTFTTFHNTSPKKPSLHFTTIHPIFVSTTFVKITYSTGVIFASASLLLTLRSLTLYIYGAPILDVSRSHTTTQHSR